MQQLINMCCCSGNTNKAKSSHAGTTRHDSITGRSETSEKYARIIHTMGALSQSSDVTKEFITDHHMDESMRDLMEAFKDYLLASIVIAADTPERRTSTLRGRSMDV
jgi:hypothetical protein